MAGEDLGSELGLHPRGIWDSLTRWSRSAEPAACSTLLQKSTRRSAAYHSICRQSSARNQGYRAFV